MVLRALALKCPVCGAGGLFGPRRGLHLGLPGRCGGCGLAFEREAGHWTGSWGLNVIVSFTTLFVVLIGGFVLTWPNPPPVALSVTAGSVALLVPVVFAPWSATLWLVISLVMRPLEPGEVPGPDPTTR